MPNEISQLSLSRTCKGSVCLNIPALRQSLGSRSIVEALESKASGRPSVNAGQMWRYFTTSVYTSGDLPVIATREALQNSLDAIRSAIRAKQIGPKEGRFDVAWNAAERSLAWSDNGIGMDSETILGKFLSLGDSGKRGAADSSEAAGGFGIAKAVILGVSESFRWELLSRDNRAVSTAADEEVTIYDAPARQGTEIKIFDVPRQYDERWSYARDRDESLLERLRLVLGANDLPDIRISLNGEPVAPLFSRRGGSRIGEGGKWGEHTTATIRAYRRPPGQRGGAFYIRLGGLFQFDKSTHAKLPADVVVDLFTTVRPGDKGYPLNAARDQLQAEANWALLDLIREVERENESVAVEKDYDVYLPEGIDREVNSISASTREALQDPALKQSMREAAGGLHAYYRELAKQPRSIAAPTSQAPAGSRVEAEPAMGISGLEFLTTEALGAGDVRSAAATVKTLLSQAGELDSRKTGVLDRITQGRVESSDVALLSEVIHTASSRAVENALRPGGAGLLQASLVESQIAPLAAIVPATAQRSSPFGALAGLRISKKNFDRARAYRFRREYGRWMPYLVAWDAALRLIAAEGRIKRAFAPGFVLDDNFGGLAAIETTPSGAKRAMIYIHPFTFRSVAQAHKDRPLSVAFWLHGLACHELTHLDGRMGEGHSESFVSAREDLGFATAHLLQPLSELVAKVLGLKSPARPPQPQLAKRVRKLAQTGVDELSRQLLEKPGAGIDPEYLKGVLRRFQPTLVETLERLILGRISS